MKKPYTAVPQNQYLALLRGINVGGNNIIKMTDLKSCFEGMGFTGVQTFIQSGNVIFRTKENKKESFSEKLKSELRVRFRYDSRIALLTHRQLRTIVTEAPEGFGTEPDKFRYDAVFLLEPLTVTEIMRSLDPKAGVDRIYGGSNVVYFARLISKATQSHLTRIISLPVYQNVTIRNWNTTTRLLSIMEQSIP